MPSPGRGVGLQTTFLNEVRPDRRNVRLGTAGCAPGDIDMIMFTHGRFDHLWGVSDGKNESLLFPSAEFVASETEVAFWSAELPGKVSPALMPLVTQANLKLASPRLRLIKAAADVAPGVTTFDTVGHTPGHISVHISSGGEEMLLTGDVVVNSAVSFLHPEWPFGFDMDEPLATKTRMAFLDRAAADKTLVGSYHLPFPGFGPSCATGAPTAGYRQIGSGRPDSRTGAGCTPPPAS
jgi:glyoxylase-like metal-dependent hydrolase (beta-lactamase superfamily II)